MKKIIFAIVSCIFLLALFSCSAQADSYYILKNQTDTGYYFYSLNSSVPFSEYSFDICTNQMIENSADNSSYLPFKTSYIELGCTEQFLYRILIYTLREKENINILYDSEFSAEQIKKISDFASRINVNAVPYSQDMKKAIYIGNSETFRDKLGQVSLSSEESVIYLDRKNDYIAIVGDNSQEALNYFDLLINIYNKDFSDVDCVILTGCGSEQISVKEVVENISLWNKGKIAINKVLKSIEDWLNG